MTTSIATLAHNAVFNFRTQGTDTPAGKALLELVSIGKLPVDALEETEDKGQKFYKRKAVTVAMQVPDVRSLVRDDVLSADQLDHLQALLVRYFEDKQKVLVDEASAEVIDWAQVLSQPYTVKVQTVKVTAEMLKAAGDAIVSALRGAIDGQTYAKETGIKAVETLFAARASMASCLKFKAEVLERLQSVILTAAEVLEGAGQLEAHAHAVNLIVTNISNALAPKQAELSADDI